MYLELHHPAFLNLPIVTTCSNNPPLYITFFFLKMENLLQLSTRLGLDIGCGHAKEHCTQGTCGRFSGRNLLISLINPHVCFALCRLFQVVEFRPRYHPHFSWCFLLAPLQCYLRKRSQLREKSKPFWFSVQDHFLVRVFCVGGEGRGGMWMGGGGR